MGAAGAAGGSGNPIIAIIAIVLVAVGLIALFSWLKKVKAKQVKRLKEKFSGQTIVCQSSANFFGQQSKGYKQSRGNGALIMTANELYFSLLVPANEISIPIKDIKEIRTGKSFLGKSKFKALLIIDYSDDGNTDSVAWLVSDLPKWTEEISKLIKADRG